MDFKKGDIVECPSYGKAKVWSIIDEEVFLLFPITDPTYLYHPGPFVSLMSQWNLVERKISISEISERKKEILTDQEKQQGIEEW